MINYLLMKNRPQTPAYFEILIQFEKLIQMITYFLKEGNQVITPLFKVRPAITGVFDNNEAIFDPSRHNIHIRTSTGLRLYKFTSNIQLQKGEAQCSRSESMPNRATNNRSILAI